MKVDLPIAEPSPDDWPHRLRVKKLLRSADRRGLGETLMMHSLSLYGLYIWSLDDGQLDELATTFGAVFALLDEPRDNKDVH